MTNPTSIFNLSAILSGRLGAEFFTDGNNPMVSYNSRQYKLTSAPALILKSLDAFLEQHPEKVIAYKDLCDGDDIRTQCVKCLFSNLDGTPDITNDGVLIPEYVECSRRGFCKWEGIGCLARVPDMSGLSSREMEIADLADLTNKEIADKLFLSQFTVSTHLQNIQRKLGVRSKKQVIKIRQSIKLNEWK